MNHEGNSQGQQLNHSTLSKRGSHRTNHDEDGHQFANIDSLEVKLKNEEDGISSRLVCVIKLWECVNM